MTQPGQYEALHEKAEVAAEASDREPANGTLCPSFPFPLLPLRYPGASFAHPDRRPNVFDPPEGQPRFQDETLRRFAEKFHARGGPLRTGFFVDEDGGAVFGEETSVDLLARNFLGEPDSPEASIRVDNRAGNDLVSKERSSNSDGIGRKMKLSLNRSWEEQKVRSKWRPSEQSNYVCLLSQHSYTLKLCQSLLMVVLSSCDLMTSLQLCVSLFSSGTYSDLRNTPRGLVIVYTIIGLVLLYILLWLLTARSRANAQIRSDIDYVGDLVWPTGAPNGESQGRPARDQLASNFAVRCALMYMHLYQLPFLVREAVQLCHPRKGAMKFGACSRRGNIPRFFALGYVNKAGILSSLPHLVLVKLPLIALKVYMFVSLQRSPLLLGSILLTITLNGVKAYQILLHIQDFIAFKRWLVESEDGEDAADRTVREKLLKKHFYFTDSHSEPGTRTLEDPGVIGLLQHLCGWCRCSEETRTPSGYLDRWQHTSPEIGVDLPGDGHRGLLKAYGSSFSGSPGLPAGVVEKVQLADPDRQQVREEFWYTKDGRVTYDDPAQTPAVQCCDGSEELVAHQDWLYGRVLTTSTFVMELCSTLLRASCTVFYNISMFNLLVMIVTSKDLAGRFDRALLGLFLVSRLMWVFNAMRRAQKLIVMDWRDRGEYVMNVDIMGRLMLLLSVTVVEMFTISRIVREAVLLMHPDKRAHPLATFGGKRHGPRTFLIGFASKDMYVTESLHGILPQIPLLLADLALTASLCWTLRAKIGLVGSLKEDRLWTRLMCGLVIILTAALLLLKVHMLIVYFIARYRYRPWLKKQLEDESLPQPTRRELQMEWRAYFSNSTHVLPSSED
eukprot:TRINITY_DN12730_c0_g1_i1.p1 TRINITY_DN12730_c0_g1~~TRINITY_DN12730_c0_g1_i1.p1  ORF type:complete len:842 (-),score=143.55 TRINITY_DN12730_c0_g1_i1:133-2658(-)